MKQNTTDVRGYYRLNKSWYANENAKIEVCFGMYSEDGGTTGELVMLWVDLDNKKVAKIICFEDSFSALALFSDVIIKLGEADSMLIQEDDFCKILDQCGFKDFTNYKK